MSKNFLDFRFFGLLSLMFVTGCNLSSLAAINDTTDTQDTVTPDVSQPSTDSRFDLSTDEGVFRHRVAGRTITIVDSAGKQSSITFSDDGLRLLSNTRTVTADNIGSEALESVRSDGNVSTAKGIGFLTASYQPITASSATYAYFDVTTNSAGDNLFTHNYTRVITLNLGSRSGTIKTEALAVDLQVVTNKTVEYNVIFDMD